MINIMENGLYKQSIYRNMYNFFLQMKDMIHDLISQSNEPVHEILELITCTGSDGSDKPA